MNRLQQILLDTRAEVARRKVIRERHELTLIARELGRPRGFAAAIERAAQDGFALITEVKQASPSRGVIRRDFDPAAHARAYAAGGATCLSVLTDAPYFLGHADHLRAARAAVDLPVLRKDFIIDPWQVAESRAVGADAILLIMAAVDDVLASEIEDAADDLAMDVLVEVHDEAELERALLLKSPLVGINNRDLGSFTTDLSVTERLAPLIPSDRRVIAESGIRTTEDLERLAEVGVRAFLVGEVLMRVDDVEAATRALLTGR